MRFEGEYFAPEDLQAFPSEYPGDVPPHWRPGPVGFPVEVQLNKAADGIAVLVTRSARRMPRDLVTAERSAGRALEQLGKGRPAAVAKAIQAIDAALLAEHVDRERSVTALVSPKDNMLMILLRFPPRDPFVNLYAGHVVFNKQRGLVAQAAYADMYVDDPKQPALSILWTPGDAWPQVSDPVAIATSRPLARLVQAFYGLINKGGAPSGTGVQLEDVIAAVLELYEPGGDWPTEEAVAEHLLRSPRRIQDIARPAGGWVAVLAIAKARFASG